ncbi:MAG: hypothetical protein ACOH16_09200 [Propionibacteriaceae bacterium]
MSAEPGIREAVRQLGRAVLTLLRAVVGAVGRKHPAVAGPADSGPPQEWLDLVAQTDPDWLARSEWAARAGRTRLQVPRSRRQRPHTTRAVPDDEPVLEEEWAATEVGADHRPTSVPSAPTTEAPGPDEEVSPSDARMALRHHARPQPRRLVLVEPVADTVPTTPRPPANAPTPPRETALADLVDPRASSATSDFPSHRPLPKAPVPWEEAPSRGKREVRDGTEAQGPTSEPREAVRDEPWRRRTAGETGPLPAHVQELPGIWTSAPTQGPRPALVPTDRPSAATALTWPELPRTESLDEPDPTPGLAARLWLADDRPDSLTAAQRRT